MELDVGFLDLENGKCPYLDWSRTSINVSEERSELELIGYVSEILVIVRLLKVLQVCMSLECI
jgi:hypothetical protein